MYTFNDLMRKSVMQMFDSSKILKGLIKACDKRTVPVTVLEQMVNDIERDLRNSLEREVSSKQIGELVMQHLRKVDQVAYVRFASVYRNFEDVSTFIDEIRKLQKELHENRENGDSGEVNSNIGGES